MKTKVLIVISLVSFYGLNLWAQESIMAEINYSQLETFIQLAKDNYPKNKIVRIQEERSKAAVSAARVSYLDLINVHYFYRPEDRTTLNPDNPFIINGFQFGVSLSPGIFFQKPYQVKQAKAEHQVMSLQREEYEFQLENEVKSRYYDYIFLLNEIKIKTGEAQALKALFDDTRLKFELGEAELDAYNNARANVANAVSTLTQTEVNFLKAKDSLEELIGVKISNLQN